MLAVLNRYRIFLIILSFILLTVLLWLFIAGQGRAKAPSRGVFVLSQLIGNEVVRGEAIIFAADNDKG